MALYIRVSLECDMCGLEDTIQPSVHTAVEHWRYSGGTVDDDGFNALCEVCAECLS